MAGRIERRDVTERRRRPRLWVAAAVAAVLGLAAIVAAGIVLAQEESAPARPPPVSAADAEFTVEAGKRAPELSGTNPITGKPVSLADFEGKPVVVNIWASWCPPCRAEAPAIKRFVDAHPEAVMLGIDFQDTVEGAKAFYREFAWTHPSISDSTGELAQRLGLQGLPTTIFLTSEHREVARVVGETDFVGLERGLRLAKQAS
ncbi:MAG: TlpA family protein disulfide reductase [Gaiellaceae bacterium]